VDDISYSRVFLVAYCTVGCVRNTTLSFGFYDIYINIYIYLYICFTQGNETLFPSWQKESWQTFEQTSGYVRPERVNNSPNSITDILLLYFLIVHIIYCKINTKYNSFSVN
jgi:hypothetical protein